LISLHSVHPMTRRMSYFSHLTQLLSGLFILFSMTTNKLSYISAIYFQFRYLAPRYIVYLLVKRRSRFPYGGPLNALHKTLRFSAITIQSFFQSYFPKYLRLIYLGFKGFAIYDSEYLEIWNSPQLSNILQFPYFALCETVEILSLNENQKENELSHSNSIGLAPSRRLSRSIFLRKFSTNPLFHLFTRTLGKHCPDLPQSSRQQILEDKRFIWLYTKGFIIRGRLSKFLRQFKKDEFSGNIPNLSRYTNDVNRYIKYYIFITLSLRSI